MPSAYSYIRMSTPEQLKGDSLRRQLDASRKYAADNGLELDESLRDIGISAYRGRNRSEGALARFLDLVRTGNIEPGSTLIVESLDRVSRQEITESMPLFLQIINAGVCVVTLTDGMTYTRDSINAQPWALMGSLMVMIRAHEESKTKGKRVHEAWENKRRRAAEEKVPLTRVTPAWLRLVSENGQNRYEVIKERADVIRRIFDEASAGIGKRRITAALNADGIPAFKSTRGWHPSYIQKILTNPAVIGVCQPHILKDGKRVRHGDEIRGYFPSVVDEDVFWRVQSSRAAMARARGRKGEFLTNILQGLCICGHCGATMRHISKGAPPKGGRYYVCDGWRRRTGCEHGTNHRADRLENYILVGLISEIDLASVIKAKSDEADAALAEVASAEAEAAKIQAEISKLLEAFGVLTDVSAVTEHIKALDVKLKKAKERKDAAEVLVKSHSSDRSGAKERKERIAALKNELDAATGHDLFKLRAAIAKEVRDVVRAVLFYENRSVIITTCSGASYASAEREGKLVWLSAPRIKPCGKMASIKN